MAEETIHDGLPPILSLDNLMDGAAYEMFSEAIKQVAANVNDPNTEPSQTRKITLSVVVKPFKDRSGAECSVSIDKKLAGIRPAVGSIHFAKKNGEYLAFGRNTKQTELFAGEDPAVIPIDKPKPN